MKHLGILAGVVGAAVFVWGAVAQGQTTESARPESASKPPRLHLENPWILIEKTKRKLTLSSGGKAVRVCHIAIGAEPALGKRSARDLRSPSGTYYICVKNPKSKCYLSMGLSYPNIEDAQHALDAKVINRLEYAQIVKANRSKSQPPWNTALGGSIFIHGGGSNRAVTHGCIGLSNKDIRVLFYSVPLGTRVVLRP
jgi:murein L,D-transpeptidase YafK